MNNASWRQSENSANNYLNCIKNLILLWITQLFKQVFVCFWEINTSMKMTENDLRINSDCCCILQNMTQEQIFKND